MPQLDISSFFSQIFWLIITFSLLFVIVRNFIVPNMERILISRSSYIDSLLEQARQISAEAAQVEREAEAELEKAKMDLKLSENESLSNFHYEANKLSEDLRAKNSKRSLEAVRRMNNNLDLLYNDLESKIPSLIESAYKKIYPQGEK